MKFEISKRIYIEAETYETRYSWGHKAWLYIDGSQVDYSKITYYNRTWESYKYETIISGLVSRTKTLTARQKLAAQKLIKNQFRVDDQKRVDQEFGIVAGIAKMGELLTTTQADANDWKARMLKAGIPGLIIPSDWDTLSEADKATRLDGVISIINK